MYDIQFTEQELRTIKTAISFYGVDFVAKAPKVNEQELKELTDIIELIERAEDSQGLRALAGIGTSNEDEDA
jgi:hypothetical protein